MIARAPASYVASRRIGQATVTVVDDGALRWNPQLQAPEAAWRRAMPEAAADGTLTLGLHVAHVRVGDASILIDTGYDDPSPAFARAHPNFTSSPGVRAGLACPGRLVRPRPLPGTLARRLPENRAGWTKRPGQVVRSHTSLSHVPPFRASLVVRPGGPGGLPS